MCHFMMLLISFFLTVGDGAGFSMMDSTTMEHAKRFGGSYNMVFMARSIAGAIAPSIAGLLIKDAHDGGNTHNSLHLYGPDITNQNIFPI